MNRILKVMHGKHTGLTLIPRGVMILCIMALVLTSGNGYTTEVVATGSNLPARWDAQADILTIGGGIAGLCLAVTAAQNGLKVTLIEKAPTIGGNALYSGQIMVGVWPAGSARMGYTDSVDQYVKDVANSHTYSMKGRMGLPPGSIDPIRFYAENIGSVFEWMESLGQQWVLVQLPYGILPNPQWHTNYRGWVGTKGIIPPLYQAAQDLGVKILTHTSARELILNDQGRVVGAYAITDKGEKLAIKGKQGVALTTGSFAANRALMARFIPTYVKSTPVGNPYSDGSGHLMAQTAGARLVDMGLGSHGFVFDNKTHANNWVAQVMGPVDKIVPPGPGLLNNTPITGICVNHEGRRFTNENSGYAILARHIANQKYARCLYIWDGHDRPYNVIPTRVYKAQSVAQLAEKLLMEPEILQASIDRYNGFVASGTDADFGKVMKNTHRLDKPPYSAVELEAAPYGTYGGIAINPRCQVLDRNNAPIPGLWAAGMATGVPFEQEGYYYEGGIGHGAVYGRKAAMEMAKEVPWKE